MGKPRSVGRILRTPAAIPVLASVLGGCGSPVVVESYLAIINISPSSGAGDVDLDADAVVTFSEDLVDASVSPVSARIDDLAGDTVGATTTYDAEMWSVRISPDDRLDPGTSYEIVLTTDLDGVDSGPLPQEVRSPFSTRGQGAGQGSPPVADAGLDQEVAVGALVQLDASASYDPEGNALSCLWQLVSLPEGSTTVLSDPTDIGPTFLVDRAGVYVISLVVNDGQIDSDADYVEVVATSS